MKRLGVVENFAHDGTVLVRASFAPSPGTRVHDRRSQLLGKVVRVFGPVAEPYAAVRPERKVPLSVLGSEVYVEGDHAKPEDRRGRRRH